MSDDDLKRLIELISKLLEELKKPAPCCEAIKVKMDGESKGAADEATAIALATKDAKKKMIAFGDTWCEDGKCTGATCKPNLSELEVTASRTFAQHPPNDPSKVTYDGKVTLTGKVSCYCK
ncbi:MAG TPA: hypothetical protein VEZ44_14880 [bacterium]|nr:hypothetical protein [bacterium]